MMDFRTFLIDATYFAAALLFIIGLKRMSAPRTARGSILWVGWAMALAILVTFFWPDLRSANMVLVLVAIAVGGSLAWYGGRKTPVSAGPQMIALYTAMGGGAAAAIAAMELAEGGVHGLTVTFLAVLGGLVGSVCLSGSLVAFARVRRGSEKPVRFSAQNQVNGAVLLIAAVFGLMLMGDYPSHETMTVIFFLLALLGGAMLTLPVRGADMPVVICLYNGLTGLAVALVGFVLANEAMIIAGTVVSAAGAVLTRLVARAMDRSVGGALSGGVDHVPDKAR